MNTKKTGVDEYIDSFPKDIQQIMNSVRETIRKAAPEAVETIKYGMPTYVQNGNLVSFGGFAKHIGLYPAVQGDDPFNSELAPYLSGKASVQLPYSKPVPHHLVAQLVKIRISQLEKLAEERKSRKKGQHFLKE